MDFYSDNEDDQPIKLLDDIETAQLEKEEEQNGGPLDTDDR